MRTHPINPSFGMLIKDVTVKHTKSVKFRNAIIKHLKEYNFLILRTGKRLSVNSQLEFTKLLGKPVNLQPDKKVFHQDIHDSPFTYWHCDMVNPYQPPPNFTLLHCLVRPLSKTGDTLFLNNQWLLKQLSEKTRQLLENQNRMLKPTALLGPDPFTGKSTIYYSFYGISTASKKFREGIRLNDLSKVDKEFRQYLSCFNDIKRIILKAEANPHGEYFYRHNWQEGDLAIWNNYTVSHSGSAMEKESTDVRWMRRSLVTSKYNAATFYKKFHIDRRLTPEGELTVAEILRRQLR